MSYRIYLLPNFHIRRRYILTEFIIDISIYIYADPTVGYHTQIGELGGKISGKELQCLAIACAILKNLLIVLLDEAISAVDIKIEEKIQKGLRTLCQGCTTFVMVYVIFVVLLPSLMARFMTDGIFVIGIVSLLSYMPIISLLSKAVRLWNRAVIAT